MQGLLRFIKYNNTLPIIFVVIFTGFGAAFASSPEVRESLVSSQEVARSVDNSLILSVDLEKLNFGLKVLGVKEDEDNYYVSYSYTSLAIVDYAWKPVVQTKELVVSKVALNNHYLKDLGLYVAKETGDVIKSELAFLKRTQIAERQKGPTDKVISTVYKGLIGKRLDAKDQVFPGYATVIASTEEVVKEEEMTPEEVKALVDDILSDRAKRLARDEREEERKLREQQERAAQAAASKQPAIVVNDDPDSTPTSVPSPAPAPEPVINNESSDPNQGEVEVPEVQTEDPVIEEGEETVASEEEVKTPVIEESTQSSEHEDEPSPEPAEAVEEPVSEPVGSGDNPPSEPAGA